MRVATLTTWNENVRRAETGNHKGCPYGKVGGGLGHGCVGGLLVS